MDYLDHLQGTNYLIATRGLKKTLRHRHNNANKITNNVINTSKGLTAVGAESLSTEIVIVIVIVIFKRYN